MYRINCGGFDFTLDDGVFVLSLDGKVLLTLSDDFLRASSSRTRVKKSLRGATLRRTPARKIGIVPEWIMNECFGRVVLSGFFRDKKNNRFEIRFTPDRFGVRFYVNCESYSEMELCFAAFEDERFYGFGASEGRFGLNNASITLSCDGSPHKAFTRPIHGAVPVIVSSAGRALIFEQNCPYLVTLGKTCRVCVPDFELSGCIAFGNELLALIEKHTLFSGRIKPLPSFSYGVLKRKNGLISGEYQLSASDGLFFGKGGRADFALEPFSPFSLSDSDDEHFAVKNAKGESFSFDIGGVKHSCFDLTDPEAFNRLCASVAERISSGETNGFFPPERFIFPRDAVFWSGSSNEACERLPALYSRLLCRAAEQAKSSSALMLRLAGTGSGKYPLPYIGYFDGHTLGKKGAVARSTSALVSAGISGMSVFCPTLSSDVSMSDEDIQRWLEFALFCPLFILPEQCPADSPYAERLCAMRMALSFYFRELETQAVDKGYPFARALMLHYPNDAVCRSLDTQFLLGRDILVSPVTRRGADSVHCYVPGGIWRSPWDRTDYAGGAFYTLPAEPGKPPVLIRAGASCERLIEALTNN